ncbi:ABC transporter substrate-binding protein [Loktanella sp. M215]|uniref:ABC transporter substrate-binding protein n=1 Tax=Loktanella sp. M215 TaxID=2675431 RepID=UPI001F3E2AE6|nr:ABC transporter substrate-binding protein [Loktanella sp. M215]MCF7699200.1 ABC transporter substrate-binding protein [Loktanella sp. M215]
MRGSRALVLWLAALAAAPAHADAPRRVVSMNLCTDQLAMLVAGEGQLLSVSTLSADPRGSAMAEVAAGYTLNYGLAEEIYLMQPDLVIAGTFTRRATVQMLDRLGIPVVMFEPAYTLDDIAVLLTQMGDALGQQGKAATLVADYRARLAAYVTDTTANPRAALYSANGYTSGDQTLAGQILSTAGLDNVAAEAAFADGGFLPLEVLAMSAPDTVITSVPYAGFSRSEEIMDHPVIAALRAGQPGALMMDRDWVCGTPFVLRAIDTMAGLRRDLQDTGR